jgi:hypothetical protein
MHGVSQGALLLHLPCSYCNTHHPHAELITMPATPEHDIRVSDSGVGD